jgi:hypothetical protein
MLFVNVGRGISHTMVVDGRPLARSAGQRHRHRAHPVKDSVLESIYNDDGCHRRGFSVLYRYPGEGVADLPALWAALAAGLHGRELPLAVEGLDNRGDVRDQVERLRSALQHLRQLAPAPARA